MSCPWWAWPRPAALASRIGAQTGERVSQRVEQQLGIAATACDATLLLVDAGVLDRDTLRNCCALRSAFDAHCGQLRPPTTM